MKILSLASVLVLLSCGSAIAAPRMLGTPASANAPQAQLQATVEKLFPSANYREVRFQVIYQADNTTPDHLLVYLFVKGKHRMNFAKVMLDRNFNPLQVTNNYHPTKADHAQQPSAQTRTAVCPDTTIQFLSVCPNDDSLEINVTQDVAQAAIAAGLKTKVLLKTDVTAAAYINWMSCPNLIGNFYDGDANTDVLATNDGEIPATQFASALKGAFRKKVTNIWLACEAYNNPMVTAVRDTDASQKYAAGINDLDVGPSDNAAACAMKAAIAGKPMTAAFNDCYKQFDNTQDKWGFGGSGSDSFGK